MDWTQEQQCFEDVARELANFYCLSNFPASVKNSTSKNSSQPDSQEDGDDGKKDSEAPASSEFDDTSLLWTIQHVFFDALRISFFPPATFANDGTVIQIACLTNLYKIFERC